MQILTSNGKILFEIITCIVTSMTSGLNISLCLTLDIKMSSIKEQNKWAKKKNKVKRHKETYGFLFFSYMNSVYFLFA